MKKLYKYIVSVIGILAFSACTDDVEFPSVVEEGNEVTLNLNFKPETNKEIVNSRATENEKKLYDLHFYVFNSSGELTGYEKIVSATGDIVTPGAQGITIRTKTGTSYIYAIANINSGSTYYLSETNLALLNVTTSATLYYDNSLEKYVPYDEDEDEYEDVRAAVEASNLDIDIFKGINYNRRFSTESELNSPDPSDNKFMMSGYINDGNSVIIGENGIQLSEGKDNIIRLYRILAKNTFTVKSFTGTGKKGTFTPKYYKLCNVPKTGVLIPNAGIGTPATYVANNITTASVESKFQWNFNDLDEISFYYPENLQVAKAQSFNENGESLIDEWKDREKNSWSTGSKVFTYAADNAAYIQIYGDYVDNDGNITANVNYTIHFGDFSKSKVLNNDYTDYNVIRNHEYKYEVIVNGVDDIRVEAQTTTNQDNPYAEGLIINAQAGTHYSVDAHYEARVMTFTKSSYDELVDTEMGYFLSINTPLGNTNEPVYVKSYTDNNSQIKYGVFNASNQRLCDDVSNITQADLKRIFVREADYTWMKFVRNTSSNKINSGNNTSTHVCKYPGDQWDKATYDNASSGTSKPASPWLNVFELLAELYKEGTYTDEGVDPSEEYAYYTCFIDENFYPNRPWTDYTDKDPRFMLIANDLDVSEDGKSIYAQVEYSISQRAITTFYTPNYNNKNAFGSEIVDEEKFYNKRFNNSSFGSISNAHNWNARTSAVNTNTVNTNTVNYTNWYANMTTQIGIQPLYSVVVKACMSRNRDLDGDGVIDGNEVRWYLPAVEQYRALMFGQSTLDESSKLINGDELTDINNAYTGNSYGGVNSWGNDSKGHQYRAKYHYFTSSNGPSNVYQVFWPEESLTTSARNDSYGFAQLVRCIRTLGIQSTDDNKKNGLMNPDTYYSYNNLTFTLDGIKSARGYNEGILQQHNEIQPISPTLTPNNLYSSFCVASSDLSINNTSSWNLRLIINGPKFLREQGTITQNEANRYLKNGIIVDDLCELYNEGGFKWRTPNQKELALMLSNVSNITDSDYGTRTRFSGDDIYNTNYWSWHDTPGFWSDNGRINVGVGTSTSNTQLSNQSSVKVRCVRDILSTAQ